MLKYEGWKKISVLSIPEVGVKRQKKEEEKKVDENNGQLFFVRHHGWSTQARLDQKKKK